MAQSFSPAAMSRWTFSKSRKDLATTDSPARCSQATDGLRRVGIDTITFAAGVAKSENARVLGARVRKNLWVRVPPSAPEIVYLNHRERCTASRMSCTRPMSRKWRVLMNLGRLGLGRELTGHRLVANKAALFSGGGPGTSEDVSSNSLSRGVVSCGHPRRRVAAPSNSGDLAVSRSRCVELEDGATAVAGSRVRSGVDVRGE